MKKKLIGLILRHRLVVTVLVLALTVLFGRLAAKVKFNNTIEIYFLERDMEHYRRFLDTFQTDEIIAIAFGVDDVFTPENLRLIDDISRRLETLPHVRRVLSLTTAKVIYGEEDLVRFDPLVEQIPPSPEEVYAIRKRTLADPFVPGTVVASDGAGAAVVAEIDHIIGEFDYKVELLRQIREILEEETRETGIHFALGGTAVLDDALFRYNGRDQSRFIPIMVLLIVLTVLVMFRRVSLMAIPLLVVVLSIIWTYGWLVLLGYQINIISTIIPVLLMAVAVADSMHFIADYLQEAAGGELSKLECVERSFHNVSTPCLMTSLTTVFGLLSLLWADLAPIRQFGLVAAGGVFFAFVITMLMVPIALSVLPYPDERYRARVERGAFARLLVWLGRWHTARAVTVLVASVLLTVPALASLSHLSVGTNSLDYFRKDDPLRRQTEWIDERIGGTASLEFLVESGKEDGLKQPSLLGKMLAFEDDLETREGVTGAYSGADMVQALNRAFHGGDAEHFTIPSSSAEIAQQLLLVEGSRDAAELFSDDYSRGRITVRVEMNETQRLAHEMPDIERQIETIFGDTVRVTPTGIVYLMNRMERYLLSSQIKTFLVAFAVISATMLVMLHSVKLGVLAMIPNILPIVLTLGLMPVLGIALDVGTVMIAGVSLGLVVDDTIHFLAKIQVENRRRGDIRRAIAAAMKGTGRPIVFTSIVLSVGFLVLVLASFNPLIHFGLLQSIVIISALFFDLLVLPSLLGLTATGGALVVEKGVQP